MIPVTQHSQRQPEAPQNPMGRAPLRRPGSIRRTSTSDTSWPEGFGGPMRMIGRCRDLVTPYAGVEIAVAEDWTDILVTDGRIESLACSREQPALSGLVGMGPGGRYRRELSQQLAAGGSAGSPLHLLLDDFCGAALIAPWAWTRWDRNIQRQLQEKTAPRPDDAGRLRGLEGVCAGYRAGSSGLRKDGAANLEHQSATRVPDLRHEDDATGWHRFDAQQGVGMRRARRMDLWVDDKVRMDVAFQDSATSPDGGDRLAVHEYLLTASADPLSGKLVSVQADARILPFPECPSATSNVSAMLGATLAEMRSEVLSRLPGILGCTHLNDVMRTMADAPCLANSLQDTLGRGGASPCFVK